MKLIQFTVASLVSASTGNPQTQTSHRTTQPAGPQYKTVQTHRSFLQTMRNGVTSISSLLSRLITANQVRLQQNKNTARILQLNAHYLKDIGLTYNDLADLKSGQKSLSGLSRLRSESRNSFDQQLKNVKTSKIEVPPLRAANQEAGELASCG